MFSNSLFPGVWGIFILKSILEFAFLLRLVINTENISQLFFEHKLPNQPFYRHHIHQSHHPSDFFIIIIVIITIIIPVRAMVIIMWHFKWFQVRHRSPPKSEKVESCVCEPVPYLGGSSQKPVSLNACYAPFGAWFQKILSSTVSKYSGFHLWGFFTPAPY